MLRRTFGLRTQNLICNTLRSYSQQAGESNSPIIVERLRKDGKENGVVVIKFNNPKQLNALSEKTGMVFEEKIQSLRNDSTIRAVILTGEGKAFSAGGDLEFLYDRMKVSASENSRVMEVFYRRFLSIRSLPVPVIAALNGPAVGAGFAIAFACDLRIASDDAKMGFNFVKLGISPGMGSTYFLPLVANRQIANKLLLTGEIITPQEALANGLVLNVYPKYKIYEEAVKLAEQISSASPVAIRETVKALRGQLDQNLNSALMREADGQAHCYSETDLKIGLEAVKSKTTPQFPDYRTWKN